MIFHVSILRNYTLNQTHVVEWGDLVVDADGTFEEGLVRIMDSQDQVLQCKTIRLVKVLWQHRGVEVPYGNTRTQCVPIILSYFRTKVCCLVI